MSNDESYIEKRIRERDARNVSLAEQMLKDMGQSVPIEEAPQAGGDSPGKLPPCSVCNGKGSVQGLFSRSECFACDGTGYDLSNPVAIIKHQRRLLSWAKAEIMKARRQRDAARDTRTEQEKEADAVSVFYSSAKIRKND